MVRFQSTKGGVRVFDDNDSPLGVALSMGRPLGDKAALAQLGYVADEAAPGGVRRLGAPLTDGAAGESPARPSPARLIRLNRQQLDAQAVAEGVAAPDRLPNKTAVVDAIVEVRRG